MSGLWHQLPVLLVVVPLSAAGALAALGPWLPRVISDAAATGVSAACAVGTAWLTVSTGSGRIVQWVGGWEPRGGTSVGITLVADRLSAGLALTAAVLVCLALVYSWRFIRETSSTYHVLMLVFLAAMTGFALAGDLFNAFVWFELMGAAGYALCGMRVEEPRSVDAALRFAVVNSIGASFSLVGISLLYAHTGQLNLALVGRGLEADPAPVLTAFAFGVLLTGVLVKAAAVPFHFWTADAEALAPSPVCAVMSGAMVATGVYAVARWWWVAFDGVVPAPAVHHLLLGIGTATALLGGFMCTQQRHLKRVLAYSTISHVGVALLGVGLLDEHGLCGAAGYLLGHACTKGALFLAAGVLLSRFGTVDEHALFGQGRGMTVTASVFLVGALGLTGLPGSGLWLGKTTTEHAMSLAHQEWLVAVVVAAGALTGGAVLRITGRIFLGLGADPRKREESAEEEAPEGERPGPRAYALMLAPAVLLLAAGSALGLVPGVHDAISVGATAFVDRAAYVAEVLHPGSASVPAVQATTPLWTPSSVVLGLSSTAAALVVAALSLWGPLLPGRLRRASRPLHAPVRVLHTVHRADVSTQVAWLVAGAAATCLVLSW